MEAQVIGAGGHARVVIATLRDTGHDVIAVWDDDPTKWGTRCLGVEVRGGLSAMRTDVPTVVAVGDNRTRARIAASISVPWATCVHPRAWVDSTARLGAGTVVFAGAIIQPQAVIGAHVIVNTAATIDHDCRIGDFTHLGPGVHLCGNVDVGIGAMVGVGACARPGSSIGEWSTVGAGGAVVGAVAPNATVMGVPARERR